MEFKTSDHVLLHYTDTQTDLPAIICLPGIGASGKLFNKMVDLLKDKYRVLVLDPRNQGLSQRTYKGQRMSRHALDLEEFLAELKLTNVIVIGNSMGASTLFAYASLFGKGRFAAMIDLDQPPKMINDDSWNFGYKDLTWDNFPISLKYHDTVHANYVRVDPEIAVPVKLERQEHPYDESSNYNFLCDHAFQDWRDVVMDLPVPLLVLAGEKSPYFNCEFAQAMQYINEKIESQVLAECGHILQAERPEETTKAILSLLERHGL